MSHFAERSQRQYARYEPAGAGKASDSSSSDSRRQYQQHSSDRRDRSPRSSDRRNDRGDDDAHPHKALKSGWNERRTPRESWGKRRDPSPSSQRHRIDDLKDTKPADLTIRGAAKRKNSITNPPTAEQPSDRHHRRPRSPDLLDRLSTDRNREGARERSGATDRYRGQDRIGQHAKRPRSDYDSESSRYPPHVSGSSKLAPRGVYDDNGRRIDDEPIAEGAPKASVSSSHARRQADNVIGDCRNKQPLQDAKSSRQHEERIGDRPYSSSSQRSTTRDNARPSPVARRSLSPDPRSTGHARGISPRESSSRDQPTSRYNDAGSREVRARQWGVAKHDDDRKFRQDSDDEGAYRRRRRRSPSPARSDMSRSSRYREESGRSTAHIQSQSRDRPARWRGNKSPEPGNSWTQKRGAEDRWRTRRNDRDQKQNEEAKASQPESSSGRLLFRKTDVPNDSQMSASQTSPNVTSGGWKKLSSNQENKRGLHEPEHEKSSTIRPEAHRAAVDIPQAGPGEAYVSINQVGEGTYGQVFKARSEQSGVLVALKKIRMESEKEGFPITAMREIKLLQALRHENVVRLHEMMVTRGSIYMVFEYMEHDLNGILAHEEITFSEAHRKSLALQLLTGLEYLHKKAVLHRDLKGSNILLNNEGRLKLADFGLARFFAKRRTGDYTNRVVTLWYRPPELLFGETQYGLEVDMWGAGCLFLELFVRKPVFQGESEIQQVQVIADILGPMTPAVWPGLERLAWYKMVKPEIKSLKDAARAEAASDRVEDKDFLSLAFRRYMPASALQVASGLLTYDPRKRWSSTEALQATYFSEAPKPELPARILSALDGEWHEYETRKARKKAPALAISSHRTDAKALSDVLDTVGKP